MVILLNDVWHSAVIDFGYVDSRIQRIKFKFSRVKICVVVGYGPNGGNGELDRLSNGRRLCKLGDLRDGLKKV